MKKLIIKAIEFYINKISGLKKAPMCKYLPTCSQYGLEAVKVHGAVKGSALAVWRILRCNPFSKGGFDPVPEKKTKRV
ncbi:MAG: membrane protein insertion efficiency factor YidD [Oscillospiraceae bacterium]|jgi:putative membrane protein insertion efficiency factor|nr:membrane protein insertion efficiency factor YidD [Oscillospiraceae bacterium]